MKMYTKFFAVLSAVFLLAACEAPNGSGSGAGGSGNANGSGAPVRPGSQEELAANVGDRVFFDLDSSAINSEAQGTLQRQAQWLKQYSSVNVSVEGHCDERGTREYNLALGQRRAASTKKYLVSLGVPANRISVISYGKERPAVLGSNDAAWAQNRRAVTVITTP